MPWVRVQQFRFDRADGNDHPQMYLFVKCFIFIINSVRLKKSRLELWNVEWLTAI